MWAVAVFTAHLNMALVVARSAAIEERCAAAQRQVLMAVSDNWDMLANMASDHDEVMKCVSALETALESYGLIDTAR